MNERKNKTLKHLKELKNRYSRLSVLRLVSFLISIVFLISGITGNGLIFIVIGIILFALFMYFVQMHTDLNNKIKHDEIYITVLDRYISRKEGKWTDFSDDGSEYLSKDDTLSYDLDLLGRGSLYQYISVAHSLKGKKLLADTLSMKRDVFPMREKRYEAIKELAGIKDSFRYEFETMLIRTSSEYRPVNEDAGSIPFWMYIFMALIPIINIISIVLVLGFGYNPGIILITFMAGLMFSWIPKGKVDSYISPIYGYGKVAGDYYLVLNGLSKVEFESELLREQKGKVTGKNGILKAVKSMEKIGGLSNISFNPLIHMLLSGFVGWDFYLALIASRWTLKNKGVFDESGEIIAELEELISLSVLMALNDTCKPEIISDRKIEFEDLYHPLISSDKVVRNSAELSNSVTVITGSNMSGKTTFMRAIAINTVLCYIGCGAAASTFRVPHMKLFTSMRVRDDVSEGISTFYAEILRIKAMADYAGAGNELPMLCLIDEIFKGTNSADRIVGATEAVSTLSDADCMVILTTHDFELCDLKTKSGKTAENYHFEESYKGDEIVFDYKLKHGRCTTRNAISLLKMVGIVKN